MPQILMVWIHLKKKKRNDIVIVLMQPGQQLFSNMFFIFGTVFSFFSDADNKKTAFCTYLSS